MLIEKECPYCHNTFITNDQNRKFCNNRCAAYYTNNIRKQNGELKHSEETKRKISHSVRLKIKPKTKFCKICGSVKGECKEPHICSQYMIKRKSINLQKLGFDFSVFGTSKIIDEYWKIYSYLVIEYLVKQKTLREICDQHGMTCESSLVPILDMFQIKRRNISEAGTVSVLKGKSFIPESKTKPIQFKHGWYTTWDNNQVYYRSSYELDMCKILDSYKIHYEMEFLRIPYYNSQKKKICVAIPDFYIPSSNTIIEIKSEATYNKTEMIDRFKAYKKMGFKNYKLILEHIDYGKRLPNTKEANKHFL